MNSLPLPRFATVLSQPDLRHVAHILSLALVLAMAASSTSADTSPWIALDVGHSLQHSGALSARGRTEFAFNRDLATVIARVLHQRAFRVQLIGSDGTLNDLHARPQQATGAAILLSIHHDSAQPQYLEEWVVDGQNQRYTDRFSGFSLFISRRNPQFARSLACATQLGAHLRAAGFQPSLHHAEAIPGENRPFADRENGVYVFDDLVVLRTATQAAILLEAGVIVNRSEEWALRQLRTQTRMATALADGFVACFKSQPPL